MRKGFLSIWVAIGVVACSVGALSQSHADSGKTQAGLPKFVPGEVVVKLKQGKGIMALAAATKALQSNLEGEYQVNVTPFQSDKRFLKVKVENQVSMEQLLADVKATKMVEYAEPNYLYYASDITPATLPDPVIPNDPGLSETWGLLNIGQKDSKGQEGVAGSDIGATKAWATSTGSYDVTVAIIDTGVDYNHVDLKNNILINTKEIPGNGIDDDGNGFVDDVYGWNFQGKNNDPMDDNRHGTHCAGTIGAEGNNAVGVAGVNWKVKILPIKFLSASGSGSLADAVDAIKYATKRGVKVMSNSWGGGGYSQTMFDAIKEARDKGVLFVAAAGNDGNNNDTNASYPASYALENVVSVAATDNRDVKATWSNWGARTVHLAAPGVNIYSTVPMNKGEYQVLSGTSMACPHVSGAAALLWSVHTGMTYADVKNRLMATVDPVRTLKKKVASGGRLNIYNAINNIVPDRNEPPADRWKGITKSLESAHPYGNNQTQTFEISHPGAKFIRVHFSKLVTEAGYDIVSVRNAANEAAEELSGNLTDVTSEYIEGDKVTIKLTSDGSVDGWGFAVDRYDFID